MKVKSSPQIYRNRLIGLIAVILTIAALRASYPITMPVLFAAVIVAAIWPMKPFLDRWLPSWLSYLATILALVAILAGFAAAVYLSVGQVLRALATQWSELEGVYDSAVAWSANQGIPLEGRLDSRRIFAFAQALASGAYAFTVYVGFIGLLVILGLPEVPHLRGKLHANMRSDAKDEFLRIASSISDKVRSYLSTTFATSLLTGIASAAWAYVTGLELALVWGLLNFLLNFVPVIGNIVGIVPPVLYAFVQFDGYLMPGIILLGFAVLQITISNFVYPILQGQRLSLSPLAIIISMAFWSWLWGIAGALIAIPLTAAAVIVCDNFARTRWFATLLSRGPVSR